MVCSGAHESVERRVVADVGSAQGVDVSRSRIAPNPERSSTPGEPCLTMLDKKYVGKKPRMSAVAVGEGMDPYHAMVKARSNLVDFGWRILELRARVIQRLSK